MQKNVSFRKAKRDSLSSQPHNMEGIYNVFIYLGARNKQMGAEFATNPKRGPKRGCAPDTTARPQGLL